MEFLQLKMIIKVDFRSVSMAEVKPSHMYGRGCVVYACLDIISADVALSLVDGSFPQHIVCTSASFGL